MNKKAPNLYGMVLFSVVEKSNVYKDLEEVLDWVESDIKSENQNENDEKQKRDCEAAPKVMTLSLFIPTIRDSFSFCFVTSKVEKSNFYKDLEGVLEWKDTVKNTANGKKR